MEETLLQQLDELFSKLSQIKTSLDDLNCKVDHMIETYPISPFRTTNDYGWSEDHK